MVSFDNQNNFYKGCFEGRGPAGTAIRNNKMLFAMILLLLLQ
jgi:hypothetical protein